MLNFLSNLSTGIETIKSIYGYNYNKKHYSDSDRLFRWNFTSNFPNSGAHPCPKRKTASEMARDNQSALTRPK